VGISGSTILEDFVVVAGQAGFAGHLTVGRGARIGGQAGIMSDIPAGQEYLGSPAQPAKQFFRQMAILRKMEKGRAARMAAAANTSAPGGNASEPAREAGAD
jgi:UDP-3-O-[3-hydroxymyristoyl] glucosamine N-acyltransferase